VQTSLLDPLDRATQLLGSDMEDEGRGEMLLHQLNSQLNVFHPEVLTHSLP